ncbi:beta-1,3-galactosyltransferase 2-like [Clarias gariepinus]|uniref:beta-1,3-galactosyltransferase 2-like n=1 Tax=Clarias gariepinus TaxID=13013 RepID=UPI00234CAEB8|nr:beta-1,3-galactosyltransferase 2-like [Clarias gariepinus]
MNIINLLKEIMSNPKWCCKVRPISNAPGAVTVLMALISLLLYLFFGIQQCNVPEFKKGKQGEPQSYEVAYPHKYRVILDQPDKCHHNPFLVIIVPVAPNDVMERNAVRNTWGYEKLVQEKHVVVLFLLGLPTGSNAAIQQARIHQENVRHKDLIQIDFIDINNATVKTMVMLEWLRDHCQQAYYAAKVDPDILFNVRGLISMLLGPNIPLRNYLTGQVFHNNNSLKNPSSRFYIPPEVYHKSVFPPFALGKCFIMSMDMPAKILRASKEVKPIIKDDLYIGLCLEHLDIVPVNPPNPSQFVFIPPELYDRCYYSNLIAVILYTPAQLVNLWTDIHKPGPACSSYD